MQIAEKRINLIIAQMMIAGYFSIREMGGFFTSIWKGVLAAYLLCVLIYAFQKKYVKWQPNRYFYLVGITLVFSFISLIPGRNHLSNSINRLLDYGTKVIYVLSLTLFIDIRKNLKQLVVPIFIGGTIAAIYQMGRVSFSSLSLSVASLFNRFSVSDYVYVNVHAYNLFFSFAAGFFLLVDGWKNMRGIYRALYIVGLTIVVVGIFLTGARKEIVCIALFLVMLLITGKYKIVKIGAIGLLLILGFYLVTAIPFLYNTIGWRLQTDYTVDKSTESRLALALDGIDTGMEHPLGVGLDNSRYYTVRANEELYAHNNYVEFFADFGPLGCMIYYFVVAQVGFSLRKKNKLLKTFESKFWYCLLISICIHDLFQVSYYRLAYHLPMLLICEYSKETSAGISFLKDKIMRRF